MNVGTEESDFAEFKRRKSDHGKLWGWVVQIFPMIVTVATAFLIVKTDITTISVRMESIQQSISRVDSELIRLREAEARRNAR